MRKIYFIGNDAVITSWVMETQQGCALAISAILLLQVISFGEISNTLIQQAEAEGFGTYEDPVTGFKINYPTDWRWEGSGNEINFFLKERGTDDDYGVNFAITILPLYENVSLNQVVIELINLLNFVLEDFNVLENIESALDHNVARKVTYFFEEEDLRIKGTTMITIKENRVYSLAFSAEQMKYSKFRQDAQLMFDSFEFGDLQQTVTPTEVTEYLNYENLVYENPFAGILFEYPEDWELIETGDPVLLAIFVPSNVNPEEIPEALSMVLVEELPFEIDLFDYSEIAVQNLELGLEDFKMIEDYETALAQIPAKKIKYTGVNDFGLAVTGTAVWTIKDNKAFILVFTADSTKYTEYSKVGALMENSFKFKQDAPKIIVGDYSDPELGLNAEFPAGWPAIELVIESIGGIDEAKMVIAVDPKYSQTLNVDDFTMMGLFSSETSGINFDSILSDFDEADCKMPNQGKVILINQMKTMEFETTCFDESINAELNSLMYIFVTEEYSIYSMYSATTDSSYNENLSKFKKFNDSIQIEDTLDLSNPDIMSDIFDLQVTKQSIPVDESIIELIFTSQETITQIEFDEESQKLSFLANSGGKSVGTVEIRDISKLLDPPYEVMMSSQSSDFILLDDTTINSLEIGISFPSPSEKIVIIGMEKEKTMESQIPDWVRNNAEWWTQGAIGDKDFVSGIQYLIKEGIIQIPETAKSSTTGDSEEIPAWIKNNADWWAQGLISDDDFVKGIQFLVENGIIIV